MRLNVCSSKQFSDQNQIQKKFHPKSDEYRKKEVPFEDTKVTLTLNCLAVKSVQCSFVLHVLIYGRVDALISITQTIQLCNTNTFASCCCCIVAAFFVLSFPLFLFTSLNETVNNRPNLVCYTSVVVIVTYICLPNWFVGAFDIWISIPIGAHYFRAHKKNACKCLDHIW